MSGFGLEFKNDPSYIKDCIDKLKKIDISPEEFPQNIALLNAIYKKGDPSFVNTFNGNKNDYSNYLWNEASFKKIITPSSQAYLIIDEVLLCKHFFDISKTDSKILSLLLLNSAKIQAQFLCDYMRNSDGLFIQKSIVADNSTDDIKLKEIDCELEISDQAYVMMSFSILSDILCDDKYSFFKDEANSKNFREYASEIYEVFQASNIDIFESKTKDLCAVIEACIEYNKHIKSISVMNYIKELSLELESRIDMSGNILRYPYENSLTSSSTCFQVLKTLISAYNTTKLIKFIDCAEIVYKKLNILWNNNYSLFSLENNNKFKYTLKDITQVISGLNSLRLYGTLNTKNDAQNKLISFFNSTINLSGIINSTFSLSDQNSCEFYKNSNHINFCHTEIPQYLDVNIAPVFSKKITIKIPKMKYSINSSSFYSDYTLFAAHEFFSL